MFLRFAEKSRTAKTLLAHHLHLIETPEANTTSPTGRGWLPGDAFGTSWCRGVRKRHLLSPAVVNGGRIMNGSNMARGVSSGTVGTAPALAWFTRSDCVLCLLPISLFLPILSLI